MDRIMSAIIKAEANGYLVKEDYTVLEKAMLLLNGYSKRLPSNYLMRSMEKAVFLRILRHRPGSIARLLWYRFSERWLGADRYAEVLAEIERL